MYCTIHVVHCITVYWIKALVLHVYLSQVELLGCLEPPTPPALDISRGLELGLAPVPSGGAPPPAAQSNNRGSRRIVAIIVGSVLGALGACCCCWFFLLAFMYKHRVSECSVCCMWSRQCSVDVCCGRFFLFAFLYY